MVSSEMSVLIKLVFLFLCIDLIFAYWHVPIYNGCVVPDQPKNGRYLKDKFRPGGVRRTMTFLEFECDAGYSKEKSNFVFCKRNGYWSDEMRCTKMCPELSWTHGELSCEKDNVTVSCGDRMQNGTVVTAECITSNIVDSKITCINGTWDQHLPTCIPECGIAQSHAVSFGIPNRAKSPWNVAVYNRLPDPIRFVHVCGGTIITAKVIVSAAHCFWNSKLKGMYPSSYFHVGIGKLYKEYDNPETSYEYVQRQSLIDIKIPYGYDTHRMELDIALLIVKNPISFSKFVQPVCLDLYNEKFDTIQTTPENFAKLAGWKVLGDGVDTGILRVVELPILQYSECHKALPNSFNESLSAERLCTGTLNGASMCSGDGGAGLVLSSEEEDKTRWYLRGVLSIGHLAESNGGGCNHLYSAYTRIFNHADWINQITSLHSV